MSFVWGCVGGLMSWVVVFALPELSVRASAEDGGKPLARRRLVAIVLWSVSLVLVSGAVTFLWGDGLTRAQAIAIGLSAEGTLKGLIAAGEEVAES